MRIQPDKWYSAIEAQKFLKIKSRQYVIKYINKEKLLAIQVGSGPHKRYSIFGEWLIDFKKRYRNGIVKDLSQEQIKSLILLAEKFKKI